MHAPPAPGPAPLRLSRHFIAARSVYPRRRDDMTKPRRSTASTGRTEPALRARGTGLSRIDLEQVRGFASVTVPLGGKVTVVIGQNGSGKTTLAEAIASMAHGGEGADEEGLKEFPLRHGQQRGAITLYGDGAAPLARWAVGPGETERTRLPVGRHLFAYGRYRRVQYPEERPRHALGIAILGPEWDEASTRAAPSSLADALRRSRTATLSRPDNHLLRDLGDYLPLLHERLSYDRGAREAWRRFEQSLAETDGTIEGIQVVERAARVVRRGVPLPIRELSDGYQAMLAIVVDLMIWYVQLFPTLGDPLAGEAMVVIDEVDLHLHPRWQREVVGQLVRLFPGTQFVLTTHSAAVVQGAIDLKYPVLVLEEETGAGTRVKPLKPADFQRLDGAQIGSVLVDEHVFGVGSRYSKKYEKLEEEAAELRAMVEAGTATEKARRRLLTVLDRQQGLLAMEEQRQGTGPLLSEIARTQIAFLKSLLPREGGKRGGAAQAKRRSRAS
jgi:hypothetical protein